MIFVIQNTKILKNMIRNKQNMNCRSEAAKH